jgi:hypothetical protein
MENFVNNKKKIVHIHWIGRFGNRMFQYAFGSFYANMFNMTYYIPSEWEGSLLFKPLDNVCIIPDDQLRLELNQTQSSLNTHTYRCSAIDRYNKRQKDTSDIVIFDKEEQFGKPNIYFDNLDMMYYPWIFSKYSVSTIKSFFQFRDDIKSLPVYQYWFKRRGTYDAAHVRRGDIVTKHYNGAHSAISIASYHRAMKKNGIDPKHVIWVSEDHSIRTPSMWDIYLKDRWCYPIGQDRIPEIVFDFLPDFLTMIFARTLYRGNSSLSWWAAFLSTGDVYSPVLQDRTKCNGSNYIDCTFVKGNYPHFMGNIKEGFHDIIFGQP